MSELSTIKIATPLSKLSQPQLRELQTYLANLGLYPPTMIDGILGPRTSNAWGAFKRSNYLTDLDKIGPASAQLIVERTRTVITRGDFDLCFQLASDRDRDIYYEPLNAAMGEFSINTPVRLAAFLAQIAHESGSLRYSEEIADRRAYEGRRDLGNIYPGDGRKFKGRGLLQLTGRYNYRKYGNALDVPLERNPRRAAEPVISARIAGYYWQDKSLNPLADQNDVAGFREITRRINGGWNGLNDRLKHWNWIKTVLGC